MKFAAKNLVSTSDHLTRNSRTDPSLPAPSVYGTPRLLQLLMRKGAVVFGMRSIGSVVTFLSHLLLARLMGVEEYGLFVYVFSWITFLSVAAKWGMDKTMVRFGAPLLAGAQRDLFNTLYTSSLRITFVFSCSLAGMTLLVIWALSPQQEQNLAVCLALGTLWLPFLSAQRVHEGVAESMLNVMQATIPDSMLRPTILCGLAIVHWSITGRGPDALTTINYYTLALALTLLIQRAWLKRVWLVAPSPPPTREERKSWLGFGMHITLINNVSYALAQSDVLIIGALLGTTAAGIYSVASRIAAFAMSITMAAYMVFSPVVAELHSRGEFSDLWCRTIQLRNRIVLLSAALGVALAVVGPWVLKAFGESFLAARGPLYILLIGFVVRSYFALGLVLLNMTGHQRTTLWIMAVMACFNVALTFSLLRIFDDVLWAAVATAVNTALTSYVLHRQAQKLFKNRNPLQAAL